MANAGDSFCEHIDETSWRGYEPKLSAWLHVADSIFVGTISSVELVESPVYLQEGPSEFTLLTAGAQDCPNQDSLKPAIRVNFEDVEVLYGDDFGETFSIQMGGNLAPAHPGISLRKGDAHPRDVNGDPVYLPGTRIGAALFADKNGGLHWRYRQFEVISGDVHLQEIDDDEIRHCWAEPQLIGVPDAYDGVPFSEFKTAIANAGTQLSTDELAAVQVRHQDFEDDLQHDSYLLAQNAYCRPDDPDDPGDQDPNNNQVP